MSSTTIVCKKCGSQLPDNARFCTVCGMSVTSDTNYGFPNGENQNGQPKYYVADHEFMEDTILGKFRKKAKTNPLLMVLWIIIGLILLIVLIIVTGLIFSVTEGFVLPIIFIIAGLCYSIFCSVRLKKRRDAYTQTVSATLVNYQRIVTRYKHHRHNHYHAIYEYEFNGLRFRSMSDDDYGTVPQIGTRSKILIKPDRPDKIYEIDLEQSRITFGRIWGFVFAAFGVILLIVFIVCQ